MSTTLTEPGLDTGLGTVLEIFSLPDAEDGKSCSTRRQDVPCDKEAVFVFRWGPDHRLPMEARCPCRRSSLQCLEHGEIYMGIAQTTEVVSCLKCGWFMLPTYTERITR